jgi:hypothetical protein
MLFERRTMAGLFATGATALVLAACGSSSSGSTDSASTGGGGTTGAGGTSATGGGGGTTAAGGTGTPPGDCTPTTCQKPPPDPMKGAGDGADSNIQAINKLFLGDTDRMGNAKSDAWQNYGFAISGKIYKDAKGGAATHCKPQDGAKPADVIVNGTNGVDNSFGKNIWPIVLGLASDAGPKVQDSITQGGFSVVMKVDKLGAGTDYSGLNATLYASQGTLDAMGATVPPGADWSKYVWHPFDSQKMGVPFASSYVAGNTWVSGSQGDITLTLSFSGYDLSLAIHKATAAYTLAADHKTSTNGNIGGVLGTEPLVSAVKSIAGKVSSSLCMGTALDGVLQQIRQASDIGADGTQDPSKVCDGISIGLGFETTQSTLGPAAAPTTPKDACAMLATEPLRYRGSLRPRFPRFGAGCGAVLLCAMTRELFANGACSRLRGAWAVA